MSFKPTDNLTYFQNLEYFPYFMKQKHLEQFQSIMRNLIIKVELLRKVRAMQRKDTGTFGQKLINITHVQLRKIGED